MEFNSSNKLHTHLQRPIYYPHTTASIMAGRKKIKNKTSENAESKLKETFKKKNLHLQLLFLKENTSYSTATKEIIYLLCVLTIKRSHKVASCA